MTMTNPRDAQTAPERFTKKPVTINAIQWTGENSDAVQSFLMTTDQAANGWVKGEYVEIGTLEGLMIASPGDWIIQGVKGEHYPCKPDIFEATYSRADTPARAGRGDLPWRERDIKRGLILFRTSNNAHGFINFSILSEKVDRLNEHAKTELADCLRAVAYGIKPAALQPGEAQGAEPVAWYLTDIQGHMSQATGRASDAKTWQEQGFIVTPLYAAPPAAQGDRE